MFIVPVQAGIRASVFCCSGTARWLACRGLPPACRPPGHFSLRGQREV